MPILRCVHTHLIESEVLEKGCPGGVGMEDTQHLLSSLREQLLSVTRVRHGLPLLRVANGEVSYEERRSYFLDLLEPDVTQIGVGNVADKDPFDFEDALPLVGGPDSAATSVIDLAKQ